jgi:hypothetical protein
MSSLEDAMTVVLEWQELAARKVEIQMPRQRSPHPGATEIAI